jgi:hypothetical protein
MSLTDVFTLKKHASEVWLTKTSRLLRIIASFNNHNFLCGSTLKFRDYMC